MEANVNKLLNFEMMYPDPGDPSLPGILTVQLELTGAFLTRSQEHQGLDYASHPDLSEAWIAEALLRSDLFPDKCQPSHEPAE